MMLWLLAFGAGLFAVSASAAGPLPTTLSIPSEQPSTARSFNLWLVQQPAIDPAPVHQSGMIAETGIADDLRLGLGLFSARRNNRNIFEQKLDSRPKASRKVGLSLRWRF